MATIADARSRDYSLAIPLYVETVTGNHNAEQRIAPIHEALGSWLKSRNQVRTALAKVLPNLQLPDHITRAANTMQSELLKNRAEWTRVRFGDVVENVNDTESDPASAGLQRFIGLEHLEPGSLDVRTWGEVADGTTFTRCSRPGQVLFGKRRAYQRKVAVAEFEAVVSGDIYVLRPQGEGLLLDLLPFVCLSERFFQHAVGTSAGSLSPRTNWSSLASFQLDLPPLAQQRRTAELLWAIHRLRRKHAEASRTLIEWRDAIVEDYVLSSGHRKPLGEALVDIVSGKSLVGTNEAAANGDFGVLKVSAVGPYGFDRFENKKLIDQREFITRLSVRAGDFLITRCNTTQLVGRVCIVPADEPTLMLSDKTLKLVFQQGSDPEYFEAIMRSRVLRNQIEARANGTGGGNEEHLAGRHKATLVAAAFA